jgi:putative addiction module component (TIGR02574 family)
MFTRVSDASGSRACVPAFFTEGFSEGPERRYGMRLTDIPEIARLSTPEKILLVEDLWDSIVSDELSVPVPQSHLEELDQRLKRYASHPGELLSLETLACRVERRK